jgi:cellulose synthase/poly-beta-1,6-N-acetylglucosamine synthase-like glycosyltransferase
VRTLFFFVMCVAVLCFLAARGRRKPCRRYASIDAIVPAYNEAPCIAASLQSLLRNPYIDRVICVNDGSTDDTAAVLDAFAARMGERVVVVHQANTGKGGALMHGLRHARAECVFLTDADTRVDPDDDGLGYMLAEIDAGADAVGGVPSSNLAGAGLLPYIRASVKLPMIIIKRTFQQLLGGAPFLISGSCGMYRAQVLREVGFSDRTKVEDLDLSWSLVARGYKVRQSNFCIVYPQECNTLREEWRRWRRWIVGYAVCMRLHRGLLLTRFGIFSILPMLMLVLIGVAASLATWIASIAQHGALGFPLAVFPLAWVAAVTALGAVSAAHHRKFLLVPAASLAVFYVVLSYLIWCIHGFKGLVTGKEPARDKPTRYADVVEGT